jgi:two-component system sensor histidine kinase QseC
MFLHIHSVKHFLLFSLLLGITLVGTFAVIGNYYLYHQDVKRELDQYLFYTSNFLETVLSKEVIAHHKQLKETIKPTPQAGAPSAATEFIQFEIFNQQGERLVDSNAEFQIASVKTPFGYSDQKIKNKFWRVYKKKLSQLGVTIAIGESKHLRNRLEKELVWDHAVMFLWIYPILAILTWITVSLGLGSIKKISKNILARPADNFSALKIERIPEEIQPLVIALNTLFVRLFKEFERKKRFASDAAHELRTPLAALKTQIQVTMLAKTEEARQIGFTKILKGIDRSTHIVKQLLVLSRLNNQSVLENFKTINLYPILSDMMAQLAPIALEKNIELELLHSDEEAFIDGNETILSILIRNLIDNAIKYTPPHGKIEAKIQATPEKTILIVSDNGPGINIELHERIFERFYRVLGTQASGSGLGLSIVKQIADLHHAKIELGQPADHPGLEIRLTFASVNPQDKHSHKAYNILDFFN